MEPLLKGPAGLDYLRKAFANRYGSPSNAYTSLPLTLQWLSSVQTCKDREWDEHTNSHSALMTQGSSPPGMPLPGTALKTGGNFLVKTSGNQNASHISAAATGMDIKTKVKRRIITD